MKQVVKMRLEDPGQKILNDPERIMNEVSIMKGLEHVSKIELGLGGGGWSLIVSCCNLFLFFGFANLFLQVLCSELVSVFLLLSLLLLLFPILLSFLIHGLLLDGCTMGK